MAGNTCAAAYKELLEQVNIVSSYNKYLSFGLSLTALLHTYMDLLYEHR